MASTSISHTRALFQENTFFGVVIESDVMIWGFYFHLREIGNFTCLILLWINPVPKHIECALEIYRRIELPNLFLRIGSVRDTRQDEPDIYFKMRVLELPFVLLLLLPPPPGATCLHLIAQVTADRIGNRGCCGQRGFRRLVGFAFQQLRAEVFILDPVGNLGFAGPAFLRPVLPEKQIANDEAAFDDHTDDFGHIQAR
ncbi:hypothetical protein P152DRAFT_116912 [Eremomyces bilateralis CBS 781.70]|uniref:Uncharacterized protein n=1 Tax=Eremomyces bilateralis CBS 781.70 TaxID=1392243 RepID=A0A6G1GDV2_9PEZI|nr:uncharacterized protein P152DRAFT_116912 [Eremomyces bilateralis CBS 781.70]KAF1816295.1 hypothetical protein P152DRAFT_116912 [Eremomyces bilateralis CBS 781.70]